MGDVMMVAVLVTLALLGSATWSAQTYPIAHDRVRHRHVTVALLGASALALAADVFYALAIAPS